METKHTPGPWHVEPDQPSHGAALCVVAEGAVIARTPECGAYGDAEQAIDEANARLIAAAPELAILAEAFVSYLEDNSKSPRRRAACLAEARAVLAKVQS